MPLIKRTVSPVNIALTKVAEGTRNELECVTNSSLCSIIRQLSSLSRHAEDMFAELVHDAAVIFDKTNNLQERVGRLKVKVTQLDSTVEEVSLQDINLRKPFKSSLVKDQQVVDLSSRPLAVDQIYRELCEPPPPLSKLNPYREDGKDSLKFYTDPQYFIELWYTKMQMDAEQQKKNRKKAHSPHDEVDKTKLRSQSMLRAGPKMREPASKHDKHQQDKHGPELASTHHSGGQAPHQHHQDDAAYHHQQQLYHADHQVAQRHQSALLARSMDGSNMATSGMQVRPQSQQGQGQGSMKKSSSSDAAGTYPIGVQYQLQQQAPAVQHQMSASTYNYVGQYVMQQQQLLQQEMMQNQYNATAEAYGRQPIQSPVRGPPSSAYVIQGQSSPPSALPEHMQHGSLVGMQMRFGSDSRESLPPPPPPPPEEDGARFSATRSPPSTQKKTSSVTASTSAHNRQQMVQQSHSHGPGVLSTSSSQHAAVSGQYGLYDMANDGVSLDLLPPPPQMFHDNAALPTPHFDVPPITPPPPMDGTDEDLLPTPPPMQLIHEGRMNGSLLSGGGSMPNPSDALLYAQPDLNAYPSATSLGNASAREDSGGSADAVMDTRSDLLAAIRKGLQLRKVEEQRIKKEQQKMPAPITAGGNKRLDVQAIMEAAFEARRQMLEDSESDFEDGGENGEWSD